MNRVIQFKSQIPHKEISVKPQISANCIGKTIKFHLHSHCCGQPHWDSRTALAVAGCHRIPERLDRDYEKIPHACSSPAASLENSSGSPRQKTHRVCKKKVIRVLSLL